ncbi:MAG TPA: metal ABC transporter ATP-binding protein [Aquabacterium sp.]|nr:metal ABC transporter ATP-binding protein [Aquabacterium sp.]HQC97551.1 metal ABC transporter ATP-binding protein [Aquabacterium sp.]
MSAVAPGAITLENVTLCHRDRPAVHHLSGRFEPGSLTAIVGPNGAGKSTLLAGLMGRIAPSTGRIRLPADGAGHIAYLPQQADIDRGFPVSVADVVMLGHWRRLGAWRAGGAAQRAQALDALAAVGLAGMQRRVIGELSAGQFQRVLFARLLLQDAPVILLDEPFNAVDERTTADLLALLHRWHREGRTVVAVLHDLAMVRAHFPRTLLLAREPIAWGATAEVLLPAHLQRARLQAEHWEAQAPWCAVPDQPAATMRAA